MTKTKQEMKNEVWATYWLIANSAKAAYESIEKPAFTACQEELKRIDKLPDESDITVDGKRYKLIK